MTLQALPSRRFLAIALTSGSLTIAHAAPSFRPVPHPGIRLVDPPNIGLPFSPTKPTKPIFFKEFTDGNLCVTPPLAVPSDIDIHRSLFVHDLATLNALGVDFGLRRVLQKLLDDIHSSVPDLTLEDVFRQFWDTQNDFPSAVTPVTNVHCDDNDGKVNGYPLGSCSRPEGQEAWGPNFVLEQKIDGYMPLALVNRLDLADQNWQSCGEHRIIFGSNDPGKRLIIFEAVMPNPMPGCQSACRPVVEFWTDLSNDSDPASRATKLENFYFNGIPGFPPVVTVNHYSASGPASGYGGGNGGQIRTDQFSDSPWVLKEFKTLLTCGGGRCDFDIIPVSVKNNPYGPLWNRDVAVGAVGTAPTPSNPYDDTSPIGNLALLAENFQNSVLSQITISRLANPDLNSFSYVVNGAFDAAESQSESPTIDHYPNQFSSASDPAFQTAMETAGNAFGLTGQQLVKRATALSCAGCHQPSSFGLTDPNSIGPGQSWPPSLGFIHVNTVDGDLSSEPGFDPAVFSNNNFGFSLSPALLNTFLPARRDILANLASGNICNCIPTFISPKFPSLRLAGVSPISQGRVAQIKVVNDRISKEIKSDLKKISSQMQKLPSGKSRGNNLLLKGEDLIRSAQVRLLSTLKYMGVEPLPLSSKPQAIDLGDGKVPSAEVKRELMDKYSSK